MSLGLLWAAGYAAALGTADRPAIGAKPAPRPFTIDTVMEGLRKTHPQATRVADVLPAGVEARENLTYARRETGPLQLDVYRPAGYKILPAVLIVHGGGWLAGDRTMERPFAKQLAARGYVAAPVSYRLGEPGRFPAPIHDLKQAVRWLRAHADEFHIDAKHIGIIGGSAGGTLATFVGVTNGMPEFDGDGDSYGGPGGPAGSSGDAGSGDVSRLTGAYSSGGVGPKADSSSHRDSAADHTRAAGTMNTAKAAAPAASSAAAVSAASTASVESATMGTEVQAVVDIDGSVNFMDNRLIESSETKPSPYWEYVHGIYREHRATWLAASPLYYVSPRSAPTLFIKSTAKTPILAGREEMQKRLEILGIDTGMVQFPNTPHPFWLVHPWFEKVLADTDEFLAKHLKT